MCSQLRTLLSKAQYTSGLQTMENQSLEYTEENCFRVSSTLRSKLFMLSLSTRVSDHGILYGLAANYRSAMPEQLKSNIDGKPSLVDHAYMDHESVFNSNPMSVVFYQETLEANTTDNTSQRLVSLAQESMKIGEVVLKAVVAEFNKLGVLPSQTELLQIAYILNLHIRPPTNKTDCLDFASILSAYADIQPRTREQLQSFVHDKLKWTFFKFVSRQDNKKRNDGKGKNEDSGNEVLSSVYEEMWHVRSFFQALHTMGVSYIEGNHRAVLASKLLYGHKVDATYPLIMDHQPRIRIRKNSALETRQLNEKSPLFLRTWRLKHINQL